MEKQQLTIQDIVGMFNEISDIMEENKEYLCELDGAIGDGDIGLTMSRGFRSIQELLAMEQFVDIGTLLLKCGMEMANSSPSTMGTLIASGFLKAAKIAKGKSELNLSEFCTVLQEIEQGISDRGRANVGDKTILDSLNPATKAMEVAIENNESFNQAIQDAYLAAEKGMKETVNLQAQHGRAGRYLEKSIGKQDPGATVGALFYKGMNNFINKH